VRCALCHQWGAGCSPLLLRMERNLPAQFNTLVLNARRSRHPPVSPREHIIKPSWKLHSHLPWHPGILKRNPQCQSVMPDCLHAQIAVAVPPAPDEAPFPLLLSVHTLDVSQFAPSQCGSRTSIAQLAIRVQSTRGNLSKGGALMGVLVATERECFGAGFLRDALRHWGR
jgi:hypothetical protein